MEINDFRLSRLKNEEYGQFHSEVIDEIVNITPGVMTIESVFAPYQSVYNELQEALEPISKNPKTRLIADADFGRDDLTRGALGLVDALCKHYVQAKREAALNLQVVCDHYRDLPTRSYNNQTNGTVNFIAEVRTNYLASVQALEIVDWFDELETRNNAFSQLLVSRHNEEAMAVSARIKEIRPRLDATYKALVKRVNALLELNSTTELVSFAQMVNRRIEYNQEILAQRHGRYAAGGENTGNTGEGDTIENGDGEITPNPLP